MCYLYSFCRALGGSAPGNSASRGDSILGKFRLQSRGESIPTVALFVDSEGQ